MKLSRSPVSNRYRSRLLVLVSVLAALPACAGAAPPPVRPVMAPGASLMIPVSGVHPRELRNTYDAARSGGRTHRAIDIHAPRGTPVLAAADGTIIKLRRGDLGGNVIYQLAPDGRTRYYYAHLDHYARGLEEGRHVRRGQVIGYVGDTGNAAPGDYHLHFSIAILSNPRRYWEGVNVNPYPLLLGDASGR